MVTEQTYRTLADSAKATVGITRIDVATRKVTDRRKRGDRVVLSVMVEGVEYRRSLWTPANFAFSITDAIDRISTVGDLRRMEALYR